jgi:hypothetical protein
MVTTVSPFEEETDEEIHDIDVDVIEDKIIFDEDFPWTRLIISVIWFAIILTGVTASVSECNFHFVFFEV